MLRIFLITLFLFASTSFAHVAPETRWKTLTSQHFEVIYEGHQQILAEDFARIAERAHMLLTPFMAAPSNRTVIWINDHTDSPNGLATVFPRNMIVLYPVLPSALDSIGHYDNWGQKLITHEYAHILNMEPSSGFWAPLRFLFGSIVRPNALLPNWYLEGFAVEVETTFTKYGRLRSPYFNALIRALVQDNQWNKESLALANEVLVPSWPYGLRPYFWGGLLMHEIAQKKGIKSIGELNERYAFRVPFFIHSPLKDLLGVNYEELYTNMRAEYEPLAKEQIATIKGYDRQEKNLKPQKWENLGNEVHSPVVSPDGLKLVFIRLNDDRENEIFIATRKSKDEAFDFSTGTTTTKTEMLYKGTDIGRVSFWPDSNSIVFDLLDTNSLYDSFSDLYRLNLADKRKERLTTNVRAQEAHVDRSGRRIVFVKGSAAKTELAIWTKEHPSQIIYSPPNFYRVSRPSFLTADQIIFAERSPDGKEVLKIFNLQTKDTHIVFGDHASAENPLVSERGVLFASQKSGVSNLYWSSLSLSGARPVTNSTTGVSTGTIDPENDELIFSQLTGNGYQLYTQKLPLDNFRLPQVNSLIKESTHEWIEPTVRTTMRVEDYHPMDYLWPQYWLPLFGAIEDGFAISAITGAQDPLRKHAYILNANYDSLTNRMGANGKYDIAAGDGIISGVGGIDHRYYYAYNLTATSTTAELQYTVFPTRTSKNWALGARFSRQTTDIPSARLYEYAGPAAFVSFSDVTQKPTEISPMSGMAASIDYQYFLASLGNVDFPRTRLSFSTYESRFLPKRNALALNLEGFHSPRNRSIFLGTSAGGDYSLTFLSAKSFIIRGYPVGEFLGWNMATGSLEYRLPLTDSPSDLSTFPSMFRRWHGAVFLDAIALEGLYYAKDIKNARTTDMGNFFYSTGIEVRSDLTLAYHLPALLRLGLFYGLNENAYGGWGPFVALSVPGF